MNRRQFLGGIAAVPGISRAAGQAGSKIRSVDIVHHTHLDVGYTALPAVVREDQIRYLDAAIDCCRADPLFRWTVETLVELDDWWRAASAGRRAALQSLVHADRMDVMGLPFNQTSFLNAIEWRQMMSWIPSALWQSLAIRAAMQNDVNGFPRAGAMALLDHGIHHLLMGINADSGGPPFRRPDAFWWKLPDGRRLFVWLGEHYGSVMNYLARARDGVRYRTDEASLRAAHARLSEHLRAIESEGYAFDRVILTHTHPQHYDNGYPFPSLASFVAAWNRLELTPTLRLTTATDAVSKMEGAIGNNIPTLEGEWTDWWANGDASAPHEVAASRTAKRTLATALSPVFGSMPAKAQPTVTGILRDLCLFDEHTWGASASISVPYSLPTLAQFVEKSDLAYRPMGRAEALLQRRVRAKIDALPEGVYVINPAPAEVSGWAAVPADLKASSLVNNQTGEVTGLVRGNGPRGTVPVCWFEKLPPQSVSGYRAQETYNPWRPGAEKPALKLDGAKWPISATWPAMLRPLFDGSFGHFICVGVVPPDRRTITQLHAKFDAELRAKSLQQTEAAYGEARSGEGEHTVQFTQEIRHPRLGPSRRWLELWKSEPRARLNIFLDRLSSTAPEVLFLSFDLPKGLPLPTLSSGGVPYTPYRDQLRGTCKDYFAMDGWADYATADGHWLWATRDAPLVAIGGPHVVELHQEEPAARHRILAMIFDNCWHTNFVADSHGEMEFQFDLAWRASLDQPAALAEALATDPIIVSNGATHEETPLIERIFRP